MLGLLADRGGQSGYDLLKRIERGVGYMWAPAKTGLYAVLRRLEERGLVSASPAKERGPTKAVYRVSPEGRAALHDWLSDPALEPRTPRDPFLLKLFFARRSAPEAAVAQVEAYRREVARLLGEWEAQEREEESSDPVELIALRFALVRGRATLGWCDETIEVLREATR